MKERVGIDEMGGATGVDPSPGRTFSERKSPARWDSGRQINTTAEALSVTAAIVADTIEDEGRPARRQLSPAARYHL